MRNTGIDGPERYECHGGNVDQVAERLGCRADELLDASASLVPFGPPDVLRRALRRACSHAGVRPYPDRRYLRLRRAIANLHGIDHDSVLPGNGAAELFTWAARDAALHGPSVLPSPGFADYRRALYCWGGEIVNIPIPLAWGTEAVCQWPFPPIDSPVIWITNPHNPTGHLWSRSTLEPLLARHELVICDEAFLPLVPNGEEQSLVSLVCDWPNLVVIRSLTKLFAIAGLRLGYAIASPERLARWNSWRDPWPVNGPAAAAGEALMSDPCEYLKWCDRVQLWVATEGELMQERLSCLPNLIPRPSSCNFFLVSGEQSGRDLSLEPLRKSLMLNHRILLRDCRSFEGLGASWLRIGLQDRLGNQRIAQAIDLEMKLNRFG